ncbi:S8 family serine peptidase [Dokdonella sp. MW10]|uniref:DUF7933 domain-containing protein n=1 Tax=Dokdonella sp. MW10 TaxID=2992926 RepID=UPI003F7D1CD5
MLPKAASAAVLMPSPAGDVAYYTVVFKEAPLATYAGEVAGIPAPERQQRGAATGKLDLESAGAVAYVSYLEARQQGQIQSIESSLGRPLAVMARMQHALNAVIIGLDSIEAEELKKRDDVLFLEREHELELHTDRGPAFIGAPAIWTGETASGVDTRGEGIVVGIIDTGINWQSPAYAATGPIDGYVHQNPRGTGNYLGLCQTGFADAGRCNDKLIGMYNFASTAADRSGADTQGHGSHTSSTVAGNRWQATYASGQFTISGVAPHANVISYLACPSTCPTTATSQSVNQAVIDGVDVINYSISGGTSPWTDSTSVAFRNANAAGIFVAASAGNTSTTVPDPQGQTNHLEPWVETVAASTQDRIIAVSLNLDGSNPPANTQNIPMRPGGLPLPTSNLVNVPIIKSPNFGSGATDGCAAYPANTFTRAYTPPTVPADRIFADGFDPVTTPPERVGAVAVLRLDGTTSTCGSGARRTAALNAGAVGVIFVDTAYLNLGAADTSWSMLTTDWANLETAMTPATATVSIDIAAQAYPGTPDVIAGFSFRGPRILNGQGMVKPDITGPGVDILAVGAANVVGPNGVYLNNGTSMSSPHLAGSAALLRALNPTWTPPQIKSALNLTSNNSGAINHDGTPVRPWDYGSGRVNLAKAAKVGLIMDETPANFLAANPAAGGDISSLNLASMARYNAVGTHTFTRTLRRARSGTQTYTLSVTGLPEGAASFTPASFTVNSSGSRTITVSVVSGLLTPAQWTFGELTLTPSGGDEPPLHMPIAVYPGGPAIAVNPTSLSGSSDTTVSNNLTISNTANPTLNWQVQTTGTGTLTPINTSSTTNGWQGGTYTGFTPARGYHWSQNFDVTAPLRVTTLRANGFTLPGTTALSTTNTPSITFSVYADNAGVPAGAPEGFGAAPLWTFSGAISTANGITTTGGSLALNLNAANVSGTPLNLTSGRYWLTVTPTINGTGAQTAASPLWAWYVSGDTQIGNVPRLYAPWQNATQFQTGDGLNMLSTFVQGVADCTLPAWASVGTTSGALGFNGSQVVPVTFNASGLSAGTYTGSLCISSNATNMPVTVVPLSFTVPNGGAMAPTLAKAFAPASITAGGTSTLTITLGNGGGSASTLSASLVDTFPTGLTVAGTPNASTTCTGGAVSTTSGSVTLASGASIPASGSCTVSVDVTAAAAGSFVNTLAAGALQTSTGTNAAAATATLTSTAPVGDAPTLSAAFAPSSVTAGTASTLTLTLGNTNASAVALTSALVNHLPVGLLVATAPTASTTCASGTVSATAGANTVSLASGAQIPANGSCTVTLNVSSVSAATLVNTIPAGALQTVFGGNAAAASDTLTVTAGTFPAPYCARAFSTTVEPITLVNIAGINNTTTNVTGSAASPALEDFTSLSGTVRPGMSYPFTLKGNSDGAYADPFRIYVDWNQDGVFAENESELYAGGTIFGSTGIDAISTGGVLTVPVSAKPGPTRMRVIKVNSTGPTACTSTATAGYGQGEDYTLVVDYSLPTIGQAFSPKTIVPGGTSSLTVSIVNQGTTAATLSAAFPVGLPSGVTIASTPNASSTCGGTVTATAGAAGFSLASGAQIPARGSCSVKVDVTSGTAGGYVVSIADGVLQTSLGNNAGTAPATLNVDTPAADPTRLYANLGTDANAALLVGTPNTYPGSTTRYTPMVCDRVTLSQPGEQLITSFTVALANTGATAISSTTTTAISFWDDTGTDGAPGVRLSSSNGLYPGYTSGYFGYGFAIPANGKAILNAAPFGYRAIRVPSPVNGGRARVWACVNFVTSTAAVTDTILAGLGVEKYTNAPTSGSTEDLAFISATGGPLTVNNPAGNLVSNSGGTPNVFGWQLQTAGQAPVLDTIETITPAGVPGTTSNTTTGQTGVAKKFQGHAATLPVAADRFSVSGTANWSINGAILPPLCTVVGNYTGVRATVKLWGTFNGTAATDVFDTPLATKTFDLGPINCTAANTILNGIPVRFDSPVVVPGGSQLGISVMYAVDSGTGYVENGDITSYIAAAAAGNLPSVGANASVNGWYRSASDRADLNFVGGAANDYISTVRQGVAIRLYGERVQ